MSRRGRSGPVISLFAFQDIITSVTAIVIVVVLFLALDLVNRKQGQASESPAVLADELVARIADVEAELIKLRQELARTDELVQQVASTSPADLRGTAYGFFNLMSGLALLVASGLAGLVWDQLGAAFTFYAGAIFCVLALIALACQPAQIKAV